MLVNTIVVGMGNTLLSDDGAGVFVARALETRLEGAAEVRESETMGLDIVEMLRGYDRAIIVDTIMLEGEEPGTVFRLTEEDIRITPRLASVHDVDLFTSLELGRRLRFHMPSEVVIFAVQARDPYTLCEGCLPEVERVLPALADEVAGLVTGRGNGRVSISLSERKNGRA
ncbi:MAG TPA: hydrogenase maturation protease [Candidatus Eisenbacteria bacterium]|uniref:Hydrogenase maturation protease n=1 Tax=Eiseniibacteriota bacterium TaxID=2212470 RepID=A0A7V2AUH4_UNCEI|nr:hydrogenase maturation protease [Candidatus Eisenbacteria bacterium]